MSTKRTVIGAISAAAVATVMVVGIGITSPAKACDGWYDGDDWHGDRDWDGRGMMGPYGYGMGPGMMGRGAWMGPGRRGWGQNPQPANLNLSANDVRSYLERWIASTGNANIKVGRVVESDTNTITADIVTNNDALVQRYAFDRHSGSYRPAQ